MALELLVAREAESEVDQLRKEVARLKKEIEFKDGVIARLQAQQVHPTGKPTLGDTVVHSHAQAQMPREAGLQCVVCVDYFVFPYTVECGHTFCYTCLHSWLEVHKSCPTCRTKLLRRPTLSFIVRDQVQSAVTRLPEPEKSAMLKKIEAESKSIKQIQVNGDLWEGIFRPVNLEGIGNTIVDAEDGVRRCGSCGWEVRGGVCTHCSNMFSDVEVSDDSQDHSQEDSEPDDYDSHDSFINDSDHGLERDDQGDQSDHGNDLYLSDNSLISDDGSNTRRTRSTRSKAPRKKKSKRVLNSDDSDGEDILAVELSSDDDEEDEGSEEEEVLVRNKPRSRIQSKRRAIMISDDDDEEVESKRRKHKRRNVALEISSDDDDQHQSKAKSPENDDSDSGGETVESDDDDGSESSESGSEPEVYSDDDFVVSKSKDKKSKKSKKSKKDKKNKKDRSRTSGGLEALFA
ncbi:E3 ubiquitin ligase [Podila clonocystis]|nr:E3 ubiquitin ligase [Podila clonocystis]